MEELIKLCDEYFEHYWIQQYAGARYTCFYCGIMRGEEHKSNCPIPRYKEIKDKMKSAIRKDES